MFRQDSPRLCEHIEDIVGAVVFRQACVMGLETIVAKRLDSRYRSGRCREWIKVKNPAHPAIGHQSYVTGPAAAVMSGIPGFSFQFGCASTRRPPHLLHFMRTKDGTSMPSGLSSALMIVWWRGTRG